MFSAYRAAASNYTILSRRIGSPRDCNKRRFCGAKILAAWHHGAAPVSQSLANSGLVPAVLPRMNPKSRRKSGVFWPGFARDAMGFRLLPAGTEESWQALPPRGPRLTAILQFQKPSQSRDVSHKFAFPHAFRRLRALCRINSCSSNSRYAMFPVQLECLLQDSGRLKPGSERFPLPGAGFRTRQMPSIPQPLGDKKCRRSHDHPGGKARADVTLPCHPRSILTTCVSCLGQLQQLPKPDTYLKPYHTAVVKRRH